MQTEETAEEVLVAENEETSAEVMVPETLDQLEEEMESAIAVVETNTDPQPEKKRLPVTIIYKSASASADLIAMQEIREDVDSLNDDSGSLLSSFQNPNGQSLLADLRQVKDELFSLDIPAKSKKVDN